MGKMQIRYVQAAALIVFTVLQGCKDSGSAPTQPAPAQNSPTISSVSPASASVGDTLTISGSNFGAQQGSSTIVVGGVTVQTVILWSDTLIRLVVPSGSVTGNVTITVGGISSNQLAITITGTPPPQVSFRNDILPIFSSRGCISCHGGSGGLYVGSVAQLLQGGFNGPVIVPGNASSSILIEKVSSNPPFGSRMPLGGPYLDDATIQIIATWINEGAQNN